MNINYYLGQEAVKTTERKISETINHLNLKNLNN